jgi:hypothetical protein
MIIYWIKSDMLYNLSGNYERENIKVFKKETNDFSQPFTFVSSIDSTRIDDGTIQTMRKTKLQMRQWKGAWAKVLFINELSQKPTTNGLCSSSLPRSGMRLFREFSGSETDNGRDLHDKSRTSSKKRETLILKGKHGRSLNTITAKDYIRYGFSRYYRRQYG